MKYLAVLISLIYLITLTGCKKYLDVKPDQKLDVPSTISDFQALLDRYPVMNTRDPAAGEVSCDDYYLLTPDYLAMTSDTYRNLYTWQKNNLFLPETTNDWYNCYAPVFSANTIIEGLQKIVKNATNNKDYNNVAGQAFFVRGKAFFYAACLWAKQFDKNTAATDLGIPTRLTSDFNQTSVRASNLDTYNQIIADLTRAAAYLPVTPLSAERSSKGAAFGMLARVYLNMADYFHAGLYADSCLQLNNLLINYNSLNSTANYPFVKFNSEVVYDAQMVTLAPINNIRARIDSDLYDSYSSNDLRKTLYFKNSSLGTHSFRGSYEGSLNLFDGISTDEMFLIRAECYARNGKVIDGENDINFLLSNRYISGTYINITTSDATILVNIILNERRKELVMRGARWTDIKRLNKNNAAISLKRNVNAMQFILPENDNRFVLPIPDDIIQLTGMSQNPR